MLVLLGYILQVVRLLLRYFQVIIFLVEFLFKYLGMIVEHINPNDAVCFESGYIKINGWLFGNFLSHCQDLVHKVVAFILNIAND